MTQKTSIFFHRVQINVSNHSLLCENFILTTYMVKKNSSLIRLLLYLLSLDAIQRQDFTD